MMRCVNGDGCDVAVPILCIAAITTTAVSKDLHDDWGL